MKPIYLLTAAACMTALLTACTSSSKIFLPDGSSGFRINCKPAVYSPPSAAYGKCLEQAGRTCGDRGYRTLQTGDYYMVIQCNSSSGSTSTSAAPTFVSLSDDAIATQLLGAWACNAEVPESRASMQGVSTYSREGKYTSTSTLSFQGETADNTLKVSAFGNGEWRVESGRLIKTVRNFQLRGLTAGSEEAVDALRQEAPGPGATEAIRFTALTDDYAVAVSESNDALIQYCRKQQ